MNIYGGTIQGANLVKSEYALAVNGYGAAFYMNSTSQTYFCFKFKQVTGMTPLQYRNRMLARPKN